MERLFWALVRVLPFVSVGWPVYGAFGARTCSLAQVNEKRISGAKTGGNPPETGYDPVISRPDSDEIVTNLRQMGTNKAVFGPDLPLNGQKILKSRARWAIPTAGDCFSPLFLFDATAPVGARACGVSPCPRGWLRNCRGAVMTVIKSMYFTAVCTTVLVRAAMRGSETSRNAHTRQAPLRLSLKRG